MVKVCKKCGKTLPISMFYSDRQMKDKHKSICKSCYMESRKIKREEHKEVYLEYQNRYRIKNRKRQESDRKHKYNALKTPCVKCGEDRLYLIQFHHIDPSTKLFNITEGGSKNRNIEEESKKCVCLCSNCHDEFHYFYGKVPDYPIESLMEYLECDNVEDLRND